MVDVARGTSRTSSVAGLWKELSGSSIFIFHGSGRSVPATLVGDEAPHPRASVLAMLRELGCAPRILATPTFLPSGWNVDNNLHFSPEHLPWFGSGWNQPAEGATWRIPFTITSAMGEELLIAGPSRETLDKLVADWKHDWEIIRILRTDHARTLRRIRKTERIQNKELRGIWRDTTGQIPPVSLPALQGAALEQLIGSSLECVELKWHEPTLDQRLFDTSFASQTIPRMVRYLDLSDVHQFVSLDEVPQITVPSEGEETSLVFLRLLNEHQRRADSEFRKVNVEARARAHSRESFCDSRDLDPPRIDTITPHGPPKDGANRNQCRRATRIEHQEAISLAA